MRILSQSTPGTSLSPLRFSHRSLGPALNHFASTAAATITTAATTTATTAAAFQHPMAVVTSHPRLRTSTVQPLVRRFAATTTATSSGKEYDENGTTRNPLSSQRALRAVELLPSYLADARQVPKYHPVICPNGALQLGVAESQLLQDLLVPALNIPLDITSDCIYYQSTHGRPTCRATMAAYIHDLLHLGNNNNNNNELDVEGLVLGAGCNAVLENLCICLAEAGESVLIPTPYYAAFEFDLGARANLYVQPVTTQEYYSDDATSGSETSSTATEHTSDSPTLDADAETTKGDPLVVDPSVYYPTAAALNSAYDKAMEAGHPPKILLLSHPHNPLGICYPKHVLEECIDWCRANQVHLISDEIYAGSIYQSDQAGFHSILNVAAASSSMTNATKTTNETGLGLGPYVHWVYALSKDLALSGLRVGVAYSENPTIRVPFQKLNDLCQISSQTQVWIDTILNRRMTTTDHPNNNHLLWTRAFREENHKRLRHRWEQLEAVLTSCGIPYLPPTAGLFCWINLSAYLPPPPTTTEGAAAAATTNAERERALYLELVHDFGLLLTPGDSMRNEEPGFFRLVFTAASDEEFELGMKRLQTFVETKKQRSFVG